jgi:hypothetical protein
MIGQTLGKGFGCRPKNGQGRVMTEFRTGLATLQDYHCAARPRTVSSVQVDYGWTMSRASVEILHAGGTIEATRRNGFVWAAAVPLDLGRASRALWQEGVISGPAQRTRSNFWKHW